MPQYQSQKDLQLQGLGGSYIFFIIIMNMELVRNYKGDKSTNSSSLIQLYKMKFEQPLSNVWGVWLSFSSGNKLQASYDSNLVKLIELNNWADFAYLWTQSNIKNPHTFFADPNTGEYNKFEIKGEMKKIQSINFFKGAIEPTWEYGDNSKGGYFNFTLFKEIPNQTMEKVYEFLIFMALGNSLEICQHLRGIRIVDTSAKKKFKCRFELWVDYQDHDENLEMIKRQAQEIRQMLRGAQIMLTDMKFFNIGSKIEQLEKTDRNGGVELK